MQALLLDTNVLIRFFNDDEPLAEMIERAEAVVVHPVVYAEYMSGLNESTKGGLAMRRKMEEFLDDPVVLQCEVTGVTSTYYRKIYQYLKSKGKMIPQNDIWIAASALEHGYEIYTHDEHFAEIPMLRLMIDSGLGG